MKNYVNLNEEALNEFATRVVAEMTSEIPADVSKEDSDAVLEKVETTLSDPRQMTYRRMTGDVSKLAILEDAQSEIGQPRVTLYFAAIGEGFATFAY